MMPWQFGDPEEMDDVNNSLLVPVVKILMVPQRLLSGTLCFPKVRNQGSERHTSTVIQSVTIIYGSENKMV